MGGVLLEICELNEWVKELEVGIEITLIFCFFGLYLGKISVWVFCVCRRRGYWSVW